MPRKASDIKSVLINIRMTPEQVQLVDRLVDKGAATSRTEFVKEAILLRIYIEETRVATITVTPKPRPDIQEP